MGVYVRRRQRGGGPRGAETLSDVYAQFFPPTHIFPLNSSYVQGSSLFSSGQMAMLKGPLYFPIHGG